ncbi:MAG: M1 family metallopeptidase, partial [Hyphomicrobiaceae bacterium]
MHRLRRLVTAAVWLIFAAIAAPASVLANSAPGPAEKLPAGVTPTRYQLSLDINPKTDRFSGEVRIGVTLEKPAKKIWFHGRGLDVTKAFALTSSGEAVAATFAEVGETGVASLNLRREIGPGTATLVIRYSAPFDRSLVGLYKVESKGQSYAYTQMQPLYARRAFPGFDEPRFKTPFEVSITTHNSDVAASNGPEKRVTDLGDGRHRYDFAATQPIPTYLVALAVGDFDVVEWQAVPPNAVRSRPIALRGIAPKGKGKQFTYALKHTAALLQILEEYFDSPYPYAKLDLLAAEAFNSGGMENVGLIIYRQDRVLMGEKPSTWQLRGYAKIHAHELAHMWFGDLVTPAWWDDLWLNEAFATWMAERVVHTWRPDEFDDRGPVRTANWARWTDRLVSARQIRQPITSAGDISNAFDSITYGKGGAVLSMIEQYMGAEKFREGIRQFMKDHRHGVATAEDFFAAIAKPANNPAVIQAFRSFVDQPGTPRVALDWSCDASGATSVSLKQSRAFPLGSAGDPARIWSIPLCLAYDEGNRRKRHCLLLDKPAQTTRIETSRCPASILPNARGAAYVNFALPGRGWDALIAQFDKLPPGEAHVLISSVRAAYEAGLISTERMIAAATVAARSPHWDVSKAPIQMLRDLKTF